MSLRVRLVLSFMLIVLVSVLAVVVYARLTTTREVRAYMFGGGMGNLETVTAELEDYYALNQSWQGVGALLDQTSGRGHGMGAGMGAGMMSQRLTVADARGVVVADTADSANLGAQLSQAELDLATGLTAPDGSRAGYLLAEGGMAFRQGDELPLISRLNTAALNGGLIAVVVSLGLALLLGYTLLRPVSRLKQAAESLASGDLNHRVAVSGKDELAALGDSFNRMADSLQQAQTARRAMTADIAHELRTPLSVQRAQIEALQDGVYPLTAENLETLLEQNTLLERLVEDLRTLALAEAGELRLDLSATDLPALAQRSLDRFRPQADAMGITLRFTSPASPCPPLNLDPARIDQIIGNLLSNALRHTPRGGEVSLEMGCHSDVSVLKVQDSGAGIPPDALEHIFERFYRADRSRSRDIGGTGLGLAIARKLAEAHGGTLYAQNASGGGALFTLTLPKRRK